MNPRRIFLTTGLALIGFGRRAWASRLGSRQAQVEPAQYAPLSNPVRIPIDRVSTPWRPVPFIAEAFAPAPAGGTRRVLISGVLFRREADLSALCVTCPHEQCKVDFIADAARPVFECGCHASVFDAARDGAKIAGETPRGLYRFRIGGLESGTVEITEIEAEALTAV